MKSFFYLIVGLFFIEISLGACQTLKESKEISVLFLDGRSVHHKHWEEWVAPLQSYLKESGIFTLTHLRSPASGEDISTFDPQFDNYDVIVTIFDDEELWAEPVRNRFEAYMESGGGLVVVHAANNAFPSWSAYNEMIGLGGWGGRTEKDGPYVYYNDAGEIVRDDSPGRGGHHGPQHAYQIVNRAPEHPIMKGLPAKWMHTKDELYEQLRGPANNMEILATAYASPEQKGSGRHEPLLMALTYGKGRIFHTAIGHSREALSNVGFITTYLRGCEWAATGEVTLPVPDDFPTADQESVREFIE